MDHIVQAIVIGVVQGLTEFLPVSSSAHLILVPRLFGWDDQMLNTATFDVMLHMGTLLALVVYFWKDIVRLIVAGIAGLRYRTVAGDPDRRLAWLLVISIIPAALLGVVGEGFFDDFFRDRTHPERLYGICALMIIGALVVLAAERLGRRQRSIDQMNVGDAGSIGVAQALALFPGISRSGITIAAGLFRGLERDAAARFAFLMGIPVIGGAGLWKLRGVFAGGGPAIELIPLAAGFIASAVAGFLAIGFLLRYLRTNSTNVFIAYRIGFAIVVAAILFVR